MCHGNFQQIKHDCCAAFFVTYLYNNKALRQYALEFVKGFAITALALGIPFLASNDALLMLFSNPEMGKSIDWH